MDDDVSYPLVFQNSGEKIHIKLKGKIVHFQNLGVKFEKKVL